jgi:hypothetical protein
LTRNPFFLGITPDSTFTGDGSDDSHLHVVSSSSGGLTPVIGVDDPMEDGKQIFHNKSIFHRIENRCDASWHSDL